MWKMREWRHSHAGTQNGSPPGKARIGVASTLLKKTKKNIFFEKL